LKTQKQNAKTKTQNKNAKTKTQNKNAKIKTKNKNAKMKMKKQKNRGDPFLVSNIIMLGFFSRASECKFLKISLQFFFCYYFFVKISFADS